VLIRGYASACSWFSFRVYASASAAFCLLYRHKDLNNAQNILLSCNLRPNMDISEML
jgi:hypothetical protein